MRCIQRSGWRSCGRTRRDTGLVLFVSCGGRTFFWNANDIRWRGETDKQGIAHAKPLTSAARTMLETARDRSAAIEYVWVFPEGRRASGIAIAKPRSRHTFKNWWGKAESLADLSHTERWGWHSLRRKCWRAIRALIQSVFAAPWQAGARSCRAGTLGEFAQRVHSSRNHQNELREHPR